MRTGSSFKTESEISDLKAIYKQFGAATCRPSVFLILLRQREIRAQVGEHLAVSLLGNVYGGAVREGLRLNHIHHMQRHGGLFQTLDVVKDLLRIFHGAKHNGHLGLGGDFEDAGAEMMELHIPAGVALGKHGHTDLVITDHLDAADDGFQGLPVIFPVDHLAHEPVHNLADEEHVRVFLLGDEGQLALGEAAQKQYGIQNVQMVADQQKAAVSGELFHSLCLNVHPQQGEYGRYVEFHKTAEVFGVVLLGL